MPFYNREEKGRPVKIKDEGLTLVNNVASIDLVGDGVSASSIGDDVTQNIPGTGTTDWLLNGNTLGSKKTLGSIDNYGIGFITNNTERLTILNNGSVGIGTTNPGAQFEIAESSVLRYQIGGGQTTSYLSGTGERTVQRVNLKSANANGLGGMWNFYTNYDVAADFFGQFGYKFQGGTTDSFKQFQVYVADVANPKMVVAGSGNVGIGTTTPGAQLELSKTYNPSIRLTESFDGNSWDIVTGITARNQFAIRQNSSNLYRLFISTSGNVGIGTTNPLKKLHIEAVSGNADLMFSDGAGGTGNYRTTIDNTFTGGDAANSYMQFKISDGTATGQATAMTLNGLGNIGIGTTAPNYKLDINGTTAVRNVLSVSSITSGNTGADSTTGLLTINTNNSVAFGVWNQAYSTAYLLVKGGNVGIGTSTPIMKLHVYDAAPQILTESSSGPWTFLGAGTVASALAWNQNNDFIFATNDTKDWASISEKMRITSAGNVGIGTTNPDAPLTVTGSSYPAMHVTRTTSGTTLSSGMKLETASSQAMVDGFGGGFLFSLTGTGHTTDDGQARIYAIRDGNDDTASLSFRTHGANADSEKFIIRGNGNVGIGITTPTAKLDINSDILRLRTAKTPSSASDTGNQGDIAWDSNYIYICTATNTWKRAALASW